jgi:hypothetical protein
MRDLVRSSKDAPAADLLAGLVETGYLYLPAFFEPSDVVPARDGLTTALLGAGWVDDADLSVATRGRAFRGADFHRRYGPVQGVEAMHRLAHSTRLMDLMGALHGVPVFTYPYKVARLALPSDDDEFFTPPHQDFAGIHLTTDVLTAWLPLTPCTADNTGLMLLPGSHLHGFLAPDPTVGSTRPHYANVAADHPDWSCSDYAPGDLVVFHSLTVHCSGPNRSRRLRASLDFRYQSPQDPVRPEKLHPYGWPSAAEWSDLTTGWSTTRWIDYPDDVEVRPFPPGIGLADYLAGLVAPVSRLLASAR